MRHSYGYHGQDGGVYSGADRKPLLSHGGYTTGDVVGAGVYHQDRKCTIFFTSAPLPRLQWPRQRAPACGRACMYCVPG